MSRQTSLDQYFKSKSISAFLTGKSNISPPTTPIMSDKNITKKRQSLSLIRNSTPEKVQKKTNNATISFEADEVINLCSDDDDNTIEDKSGNLSQKSNLSRALNSSHTIITDNIPPSTPKKSKVSTSKSSSSEKFFSPTKKRVVFKRTPVKRNLATENFGNSSQLQHDLVEDEDFSNACEGMDDKSIFLLTIINQCLKEDSLKGLLDEKSLELLNHCFKVLKPGIRLVCRLYWHQRRWYKKDKLVKIIDDNEESVGDAQFEEMLKSLDENGLVTPSVNFGNNTMGFDALMKVLKADDIKQICKEFKIKFQSKQDAEKALQQFSQQRSISSFFTSEASSNLNRVLKVMRSKAGTCYKLTDLACSALDKLYLLMYLGINYGAIRENRLELILINDKIKKETYPVDKKMKLDNASVVFRSKEEFAKYWTAHSIYEDYLAKTDSAEKFRKQGKVQEKEEVEKIKCSIVIGVYKIYNKNYKEDMKRYETLPTWLRRYTPSYLYIKILASGIQELKKDKDHHQLALDILTSLISQNTFRQHKKAEWYAEKALVLHKYMAKHDEAAAVLIEGLKSSSLSEEAKDAMRPRANKIAKQQNIQLEPGLKKALIEYGAKALILEKEFPAEHVRKQHMETTKNTGKKQFVVDTADGRKYMHAEDYCAFDYTTNGEFSHGEHWEGRIATTLFYLLFWDIIYSKPRAAAGVFLSRFQLHPLDMYDENFYQNRKSSIDDRLIEIESMTTDEMVEALKQKWDERPEYELSGINRSIGWSALRSAAACLAPRAGAALCRRLATNYGYSHSGFPDLTLWNERTKKIKFVEVKTDTDKPSMKQLQWMRYLRENGIDTGFCYVGADSGRSRARAAAPPTVTVKSVADINSVGGAIS